MSDRGIHLYRVHDAEPVVYAAEELARYLQRMDDVRVEVHAVDRYRPADQPGIHVGLYDAFGLDVQADEPAFDDRVHVDVDSLRGVYTMKVLLISFTLISMSTLLKCIWTD